MEPFVRLQGVAAPIPLANIDTDKIIPGRFLKTVSRRGLGSALFHALRFDEQGAERPEFVLNRHPWRQARILIALENFGCGSSREHAPWALLSFGIRCIIAPSFADIFYNNCFKNGLLPIILERSIIDRLLHQAQNTATTEIGVDLQSQTVVDPEGTAFPFHIESQKRDALLRGLDDIQRSLQHAAAIGAHEQASQRAPVAVPLIRDYWTGRG